MASTNKKSANNSQGDRKSPQTTAAARSDAKALRTSETSKSQRTRAKHDGAARRRMSILSQCDLVRVRRAQKLMKEDPFARPNGKEAFDPQSAAVVGCFVSHPRREGVAMPPNPLLPSGGSSAVASTTADSSVADGDPQIFVRVQLGGQAEQLLPLAIMRKEHPQMLIDYLLSTAHLM